MPKKKSQRSIDRVAKESRNWLSKKMVIIQKKKLSTLKGFLIISFFVGAAVALTLMVETNTQTSSKASSDQSKGEYVKGELLVKFKESTSQKDQEDTLKQHGVKVKDEIKQIKVKVVSVPEQAQDKVREALSKNSKVEFVENNGIAKPSLIPNDSSYPSQWHLPKISAPAGWDVSMGNAEVPITVCDTGVDPTHPDLAGKLLPGYNFYENNTNTADVHGHGTKVAGSAAAITNNAVGVSGVAPVNKIIPVRIADPNAWATYSAMANCVMYGVDHGSRVINISYGGTTASATLTSAATYAWGKNALVFASAGNDGTTAMNYPAAIDKVIGIVSTNSADVKSSFSNYGTWVDLSAPGEGIYTTTRGGGYGSVSGTSFSGPVAAGLAALVYSINPNFTSQDVFTLLVGNADDLGAAGFDQYFGWGRINVAKTLTAATMVAPTPTPEPTPIPNPTPTPDPTPVPTFSITSSSATSTTTTATISWATSETSKGSVSYGANKNSLSSNISDGVDSTAHSVTLMGLNPGATYYYKISAQGADGKTITTSLLQVKTKRR